jgi:hypothetical protein
LIVGQLLPPAVIPPSLERQDPRNAEQELPKAATPWVKRLF